MDQQTFQAILTKIESAESFGEFRSCLVDLLLALKQETAKERTRQSLLDGIEATNRRR